MKASRSFLVLLTVFGIGASVWISRPMDPTRLLGWLFACFSSIAWFLAVLLCLVAAKLGRNAMAIGGIAVLGLSELLIQLYLRDPLFLVMKPIYQTLLLAMGAAFGAPFKRSVSY
jgi:hypothetical protein